MRKFVVLVVAAVLCAGFLPTQAAANHTLSHRVRLLEAEVDRLSAFVNNCLAWRVIPIGWYGDPERQSGYVFSQDDEVFLATALDVAPVSEATFFVAAVRPTCRTNVGPLLRATMLAPRAFARCALPLP